MTKKNFFTGWYETIATEVETELWAEVHDGPGHVDGTGKVCSWIERI